MATRTHHEDGVTVVAPSAYRLYPSSLRKTPAAARSRSARAVLPPDDQILGVLEGEENFQLERVLEFERAGKAKARSTATGDTSVRLEVKTGPGEEAVVLVEEDGVYRWEFPRGMTNARGRRQQARSLRAMTDPVTLTFDIDLGGNVHEREARRGQPRFVKKLAKKAKAYVFKFAADWLLGKAVKFLERDVQRGLIDFLAGGPERIVETDAWALVHDPRTLALPAKRAPRVLLFVHGTFSSTLGSYGPLAVTPWGQAFLRHAADAYDLILGFDHPTLSLDPEENALELLRALKAIPWTTTPEIDAVGYSRGGLVLRSLIEQLLPKDDLGHCVRRAVLVGATSAGTQLAEPENWHRFLDFYTNMAVGASRLIGRLTANEAAGQILSGLVRGLSAFAKYLATTAISEARVPGLSAMEPDGPFVLALNQTQPGQPTPENLRYYAITSNFDVRVLKDGPNPGLPKRFLTALGDRLVDQLFGEDNDLVVHTASMTTIDPQGPDLLREESAFGTNGQVYHTVYFVQPASVRALHRWFELKDLPALEATIEPALQAIVSAKRSASLPAGEVVEFIPVNTTEDKVPERPKAEKRKRVRPVLPISVHWDDLRTIEADVHAVGHYVGVAPQKAELALDKAISCIDEADTEQQIQDKLLLTRLTRQGLLRGDLGRIYFFPWGGQDAAGRLAAICGMGFFGDFTEPNVRLLYRNLGWQLNAMPDARTLCTVLIGSGVGALDARRALRGLLDGLADAFAARGADQCQVTHLHIAEAHKDKAEEIFELLRELQLEDEIGLELVLDEKVQSKETGWIRTEHGRALLAAAAMQAASRDGSASTRQSLDKFMRGTSSAAKFPTTDVHALLAQTYSDLEGDARRRAREDAEARLAQRDDVPEDERAAQLEKLFKKELAQRMSLPSLARRLDLELRRDDQADASIPTRLVVRFVDGVYRVAALASSAAIPERDSGVDPKLVRELVEQMTDASPQEAERLGRLLYRLLIPRDFWDLLASSPSFIFEVDRDTAPIHWEMLVQQEGGEQGQSVALNRQVSRQLRTTYSAAPLARPRRGRRALVIGDPGDPDRGEDLPGAQEEARLVARLLEDDDFEVDTFIGAPDAFGLGPTSYPPASRIEVLDKLLHGRYEIVHYAGHGDYDRLNPSKTGWLFKSGLLTAGEFERLAEAPSLIIANACLSGRTSEAVAADLDRPAAAQEDPRRLSKPYGESGLLPSLADEVLRRGVRNYIGTAWEVDDEGALLFARRFYTLFLGGRPIGEALLEAREALGKHKHYGALWAAYQHYGDPAFNVSDL